MKKLLLLAAALMPGLLAIGQDTLMTESFETDGHGSRYTIYPNVTGDPYPTNGGNTATGGFWDGTGDYAMRATDGILASSHLHTPSGEHGDWYMAFEDTDDNGHPDTDGFISLQWNDINVAGYTDLKFSFLIGAPRTDRFDNLTGTLNNTDSVSVFYRYDANTAWNKFMHFSGNDYADGANGALQQDLNLDGTANDGEIIGTGTNQILENIQVDVPGSGSTMDILLIVDVNGGSEELTIDYLNLWGTSSGPVLGLTTTSTNVACNGGSTGTANTLASNGTTPYTYLWSNGGTTATISTLPAGTYTVTVTDAIGTTATGSTTVTEPDALVASIAGHTDVTCGGGGNDGAMTAAASGGTTGYTYAWSNGGSTAAISSLTIGTYTVTVTDANDCTSTASETLIQATPGGVNNILTESFETDGHGTRYTVYPNVTGDPYPSGGGNTADGGFYDAVNDYAMRATDAIVGGAGNLGFTPSGETGSWYWAFEDTDDDGHPDTDGVISIQFDNINVSGASNLQWSFDIGANGIFNFDNHLGSINNWDSVAFFYRFDANTTWTKFAYLTGNDLSDGANGALQDDSNLDGTPDGEIIGTGSNMIFETLTKSITGTGSTLDIRLVVDANGAGEEIVMDNFILSGNTSTPGVTVVTTPTNLTCNAAANGSVSSVASNGTTPYTYAWSSGESTTSISGKAAGTYTLTVTDAGSCQAISTETLTEPGAIMASIGSQTNITCNGASTGAATASASNGASPYTYAWSSGESSASISGKAAGDYTVSVTDANGCGPVTATVTLTQPAAAVSASIGSQTNVTCNGASTGAATASGTGGTTPYTYAWSSGESSASITGKAAGDYTVSITDANGCGPATATATITQPAAALSASISSQTNILCNGASTGAATAGGTGGTTPYTYAWSSGESSASISGKAAGDYTVSITDANGCGPVTATATLTQPAAALSASMGSTTNILCNGASTGAATVNATGGTTPYTYAWSSTETVASISGKAAGDYTVSVTDANGCGPATATANLTQPAAALGASIGSQTNILCNGASTGAATVNATGGTTPYTYAWSSTETVASISGKAAGDYTVSVTDANGCGPATATATLTEPGMAVMASIGAPTHPSCNGSSDGALMASGTGGTTPYTYAWSNSGTNATISSLASGTYTVTLTDANGCTGSVSESLTDPAAISASIASQTNVLCNGATTGAVTAMASGGTGTLTYAWSSSETTIGITGKGAGTYTISVTDANGCGPATAMATLTEPAAALSASISSQTNVLCNGGNNGAATAAATGGTTPYTYAWSSSETVASITGKTAASYTCSITDANGCGPATAVAAITEPSAHSVSISSQTNVSSNGGSDGSATAAGAGGTSPYTYAWSNSGTAATISSLVAGDYTVTSTDANGCTSTTTATITEPASLTVNVAVNSNVSCNGAGDGMLTASTSSGTSPYTFLWSTTATTAAISSLGPGTYTVTVTDNVGTTGTQTGTITEPTAVNPAIGSQTNIVCNGGNTGAVTIAPTGGVSPYTYVWSSGPTTAGISGLTAGTYTVTVTDATGCTGTNGISVTQTDAIMGVMDTTHVNCSNTAAGGTFTANPTGGTSPYTYAWSNGPTTAANAGVPIGTYTVTVTDANSCTGTGMGEMWYICDQPGNLREMGKQDVSVTLTWDIVCGVSKYKIFWKLLGATDWNVDYKHTNVGQFTLTGLTASTSYRWSVKPDCGISGWGPTAVQQGFTTLAQPCVAPSNITVTPIQSHQAKVNWVDDPNAVFQRLRYRVQGTSTWTTIVKDPGWTHHWITGLSASTTYEIEMRTCCEAGATAGTPWTATQTFTTPSAKFGEAGPFYTHEEASEFFRVFPNPNSGQFTLMVNGLQEQLDVTVTDVAGKVVYRTQQSAINRLTVDLGGQAAGMYLLKVEGKSVRYTDRVIVQ